MTPPWPHPEPRRPYRPFCRLTTRWSGNDAHGHVNKVDCCIVHAQVDCAGHQPGPLPADLRSALQPLVCHP